MHAVCRPAHVLSGIARCPKCGQGQHYRNFCTPRRGKGRRAESYACVKGAAGCRGVAIKAELLEEYVTGPVLDALESPRVQQALREGEDHHAPRRAELLEEIRAAQERRDEARRDYSGRVIDRADWLDIRQRTEDLISAARRKYYRLTGFRGRCWVTFLPPTGSMTRGNRGPPTAGGPRSGPSCTASSSTRFRPARRATRRATSRTRQYAAYAKWRSCGNASNSTGVFSSWRKRAVETSRGGRPRRSRVMPLVSFHHGCFRWVAGVRACRARSRRAPRPLRGLRSGPVALAARQRRASSASARRTTARLSALITAGGCWSSLAGGVAWPHPLR